MNPYRVSAPPRRWLPKLSPGVVRLLRPLTRRRFVREQRVLSVEVQGVELIRDALEKGQGVLITPNHSSHADPYTLFEVANLVGSPFYFMATWHVFDNQGRIGQWVLQRHGAFSIDREGADLQAFKQAVQIVREEPHPLVIFPEGEIYHCNDRVTPFREGAAAVAVTAAKRAKRPILCFPCAVKYTYIDDPTEELLDLMAELERSIQWRPRPDRPLPDRIYAFGEALMALKEIEFLGRACEGSLPERTDGLANEILGRLEKRYENKVGEATIPERVKDLRSITLKQIEEVGKDDVKRKALNDDLDDLFLVVQLFSYPGDYVRERPSIERLAETLDKFEEDMLGRYSASIRASRRATVHIGEAVTPPIERKRAATRELTDSLERRIQTLLDAG